VSAAFSLMVTFCSYRQLWAWLSILQSAKRNVLPFWRNFRMAYNARSMLTIPVVFQDSSPEAPKSKIANIYNTCNNKFNKVSQFKYSNKPIYMACFDGIVLYACDPRLNPQRKALQFVFPFKWQKIILRWNRVLMSLIWSVLIKIVSSRSALLFILCAD
jgi:hypothetical protein